MGPRVRTPADIACRSSGRGARGDQPLAWGGPEGRDDRWPLAGCGRPKAPQAAERVGRGGRGPLCAPDTRWDAKRDVRAGQMAGFPRTCCCCCCIGYKIFWREEKMLKTKVFPVTGPLDKCLFDSMCAWGRGCRSEPVSFLLR